MTYDDAHARLPNDSFWHSDNGGRMDRGGYVTRYVWTNRETDQMYFFEICNGQPSDQAPFRWTVRKLLVEEIWS